MKRVTVISFIALLAYSYGLTMMFSPNAYAGCKQECWDNLAGYPYCETKCY